MIHTIIFQDKFYEDITTSRELFMSYMNGLNASTEIRWEIMSFIQNPEDAVTKLKEYIEKMFHEFSLEYANFSGAARHTEFHLDGMHQ